MRNNLSLSAILVFCTSIVAPAVYATDPHTVHTGEAELDASVTFSGDTDDGTGVGLSVGAGGNDLTVHSQQRDHSVHATSGGGDFHLRFVDGETQGEINGDLDILVGTHTPFDTDSNVAFMHGWRMHGDLGIRPYSDYEPFQLSATTGYELGAVIVDDTREENAVTISAAPEVGVTTMGDGGFGFLIGGSLNGRWGLTDTLSLTGRSGIYYLAGSSPITGENRNGFEWQNGLRFDWQPADSRFGLFAEANYRMRELDMGSDSEEIDSIQHEGQIRLGGTIRLGPVTANTANND